MPTPFTHLHIAQRMLADPAIPPALRASLAAERGAFLLGHIAADARVENGSDRADTHFYRYDRPMVAVPWRLMLAQYPAVRKPHSPAMRAFVAGYTAHLAVDERWSRAVLGPYFAAAESWGPRAFRFFMLHILLIYMDERDYAALADWQSDVLAGTVPDDWLPFMPDTTLCDWRDFIARQLRDGSETLSVLGERIDRAPADFRAVLDMPERMTNDLWSHLSPDALLGIEADLYTYAREQMLLYLAGR